ncbi:hypothetical protein [Aurantiacibacter luteus]|uniref:Aspartate-semialdehyde dehydrogenase n=1 Tax=Aurantiacibacter luteus TaxID=1581420 RepID=A0A0G9N2J5_9SPHN|nr:hypothetical protein [Aurantiacibacter luteus]KLE35753.1 hypothetical protein AAW00_05045 [Aurantiacibacter luteus]
MMMLRRTAFLSLALALAACTPAADDSADTATDAGASTAEVSDDGADAAPRAGTLDLLATGITVPAQGGFEEYSVPFGSPRAATETTLGTVLGEPRAANQPNDCGLTTTSYEGMALHFRDDEFVGWYANAPYVPQLSREEMLADPAVEMADSTIDGEFTIERGGQIISGVFAGDEVRGLWAGDNCIAR